MDTNRAKILLGITTIAVVVLITTAILLLPAVFPGYYSGPDVEFRISKGDSLGKVADKLYAAEIIRSQLLFKLYVMVSAQSKNLKAGLYKLSPNMSLSDLVKIFSMGLAVNEDLTVTIPEGSNINDIDSIFASAGLTRSGDFLRNGLVGKEGYLFPDTYKFAPDAKLPEIVQKLEDNFESRTSSIFRNRNLTVVEIKHIIIVASLLEREVKSSQEMSLVAGIIEHRMSMGMKLEIDAAAAYGECYASFTVGKSCEVSDVNLLKAIVADSPYNTYRIEGLPVAPISNPGATSIEATLSPTTSDYLFYLTDKEGDTHFAKTLAEHNRNRAKYLR